MAKVIIAILYIAAILVIGFLAGRNVKTADEFAVANRNIPYWTNVFSMSSHGSAPAQRSARQHVAMLTAFPASIWPLA